MTTWPIVGMAVVLLATILVLLLASIVGHRAARLVRERRRARLRDELRPVMVRVMASDQPVSVPRLGRSRSALFEVLAADYLGKVRGEAKAALVGLLAERGTVAAARRRLGRPGTVGRASAAEFLGLVGDGAALGDLLDHLHDRRPEVRIVVARSVGRLGEPSAVPHLLDAVDGPNAVPFGTVAVALLRMGPGSVPELRTGLRAGPVSRRALCAEMLGQHGAIEAVDDLLACLDPHQPAEVRIRATRSLGRLGSPRAMTAFGAGVAVDSSPALRAVTARALGDLGGAAATAALVGALDDESHQVAANAARALGRCGSLGRRSLDHAAAGDRRGAAYARGALALIDRDDQSRPVAVEAS